MSAIMECPSREEYGRCIELAAQRVPNASQFEGKTFFITGASGMVGGALCRTLLYLDRTLKLGLKLVLPVRSEASKGKLSGIYGRDCVKVFTADPESEIDIADNIDYIVHAASPTDSFTLKQQSADALRSIVLGGLSALELARRKRLESMVYLSSMEVYGTLAGAATEDSAGAIDLTSPRSCYPEGKRLIENACTCYAAQYGVNACSARLAQVMSAGIKPGENRAYAQFAKSALKGEDITLKTTGASSGNYVHIADAVSAILTLLVKGEKGQSYNVCGDGCTLTIKELALRISAILSRGQSRVVIDAPNDPSLLPYAPETGIVLVNEKLRRLGWQSVFGIDDMIKSLGADLSELMAV